MCRFLCRRQFSPALWIKTKEPECWLVWWERVSSVRNHPTVFQSCLTICIPSTGSCCSTSSPTCGGGGVPDFGPSDRYLIVIICNTLITYDFEHLFICYLSSVYLIWWSVCLFRSFDHFLCVFSYCWALCIVIWIVIYQISVICKYFHPVWGLSFHSLNSIFHRAEVFNFNAVQFIIFSFTLLVLYLRSHCQTQGHLGFLLCYLLEDQIYTFTFYMRPDS